MRALVKNRLAGQSIQDIVFVGSMMTPDEHEFEISEATSSRPNWYEFYSMVDDENRKRFIYHVSWLQRIIDIEDPF